MKIKSTKFKDLKVILSPVHKDKRGYFKEVFKKNFFQSINLFYLCFVIKKKCLKRVTFSKEKCPG